MDYISGGRTIVEARDKRRAGQAKRDILGFEGSRKGFFDDQGRTISLTGREREDHLQ
jgi:hypothetical protein